jgi:hypothetical protein
MEQQMISAKQQAQFDRRLKEREQFDLALGQMIDAQKANYDGSYAFSTGYLQAWLAQVWTQLPKARREQILQDVQNQTIKQLTAAVDKARV